MQAQCRRVRNRPSRHRSPQSGRTTRFRLGAGRGWDCCPLPASAGAAVAWTSRRTRPGRRACSLGSEAQASSPSFPRTCPEHAKSADCAIGRCMGNGNGPTPELRREAVRLVLRCPIIAPSGARVRATRRTRREAIAGHGRAVIGFSGSGVRHAPVTGLRAMPTDAQRPKQRHTGIRSRGGLERGRAECCLPAVSTFAPAYVETAAIGSRRENLFTIPCTRVDAPEGGFAAAGCRRLAGGCHGLQSSRPGAPKYRG